jgi:hypothetical protein
LRECFPKEWNLPHNQSLKSDGLKALPQECCKIGRHRFFGMLFAHHKGSNSFSTDKESGAGRDWKWKWPYKGITNIRP